MTVENVILFPLVPLSLTSLFYGEPSEKEKSPSESSPSDSETKDMVSFRAIDHDEAKTKRPMNDSNNHLFKIIGKLFHGNKRGHDYHLKSYCWMAK